MTQHKPIKPVDDMSPEEREEETVRRYQEAIDAAKSGVIKKKKPSPETEARPYSDDTISGP